MQFFRSTLIVLFLLIALGLWIWYDRGPVASVGQKIVWHIDPNSVQSLQWQSPQTKFVLQKRDSQWMVSGDKLPVVAADPEKTQQLLRQIATLESDAVQSDDAKKRREFGLQPPRGTLSVDGQTLELGKPFPLDTRRIYARSGDQIALLPSGLLNMLARPANDWRDHRVLRFDQAQIMELQIFTPSGETAFSRRTATDANAANGQMTPWILEKPIRARADNGNIAAFLSTLEVATTDRFLDDDGRDLARWGLKNPLTRVELTSARGEVNSLWIGRRVAGGYAAKTAGANSVFRIPTSLFDALKPPLSFWRDKTVLPLNTNAVSRIDITWRGRRATLLKDGANWRLNGTNAGDSVVARNSAMELMGAVQTLRARDFAARKAPIPVPTNGVSLTFGPSNQQLHIWGSGGPFYARTNPQKGFDDSYYVLPATALNSFEPALRRLFATVGKS